MDCETIIIPFVTSMSFDMRNPGQQNSSEKSPFLGGKPEPIEDPTPKNGDVSAMPRQKSGKTLAQWEALEHEPTHLGSRAVTIAIAALIAIVAYAIYTDSPLMAIVFILIGMVGYLSLNRPEEPIHYAVMDKGIAVGREFYGYDDIASFWILEDHPDFPKHLIIRTDGLLISHVHIPLAEQNVEAIRSFILPFVPEQKYEPGLIDTIERIFHI